MSKKIIVAKILTSHGVKGFVKLESFMENPKDIFKYKDNLFDINGKQFRINFIGTYRENIFISKIEGINDMDVAKSWRNTELYIDIDLLPKKKDNEVFIEELIGLEARSSDSKYKGVIVSVDDFGAGIVVSIKWENESMEESLPFVKDYFIEINTLSKYVIIDRPEYV